MRVWGGGEAKEGVGVQGVSKVLGDAWGWACGTMLVTLFLTAGTQVALNPPIGGPVLCAWTYGSSEGSSGSSM